MDIQLQKSIIIEQFNQINDINLIKAIQGLLEYALSKKNDDIDVPQWHKDIVRERIENSSDDDYLSWKETKKLLKSEL